MSGPLPRLVFLAAGQLGDVPPDDEWLSAEERVVLARLKLEKRRTEWRLGRWLARRAVLGALTKEQRGTAAAGRATTSGSLPALSEIAVLAAPDGAPEVHGVPAHVHLSVSHSHGHGLAAASVHAARLGCDLELVEPRSDRFIRDWLTRAESTRVFAAPEESRDLLANLCWSAKESASKVLRVGLRFDTRAFEVELPRQVAPHQAALTAEWQPIGVTALKTRDYFQGLWHTRGRFVETVLSPDPFNLEE